VGVSLDKAGDGFRGVDELELEDGLVAETDRLLLVDEGVVECEFGCLHVNNAIFFFIIKVVTRLFIN